MLTTTDRWIAGEWAETADTVMYLAQRALATTDPAEARDLRRTARSQLRTCELLAGHVRRSFADPAGESDLL